MTQLESMTSDYNEAYERAKDVLKNPTLKPEERAALRFLLALGDKAEKERIFLNSFGDI